MKNPSNAIARFVFKLAGPLFALLVALFVASGLLYLGFERLLHAAYDSLPSRPNPAAEI